MDSCPEGLFEWLCSGRPTEPLSEQEGLRTARRLVSTLGFAMDASLPERLATSLGWSVRTKDLGAKSGGHHALLVPLIDGGFSILVDPWSPDADDNSARARCRQFRIAHELAHSIFFTLGSPPTRVLAYAHQEENFCDGFASGLLGAVA